ncbi:glycosyltransferase family 2 protein [candidate division WWE3 bacterium]|nr:glycosyltransferase family 2 protein [candidate division WWE3 bacterium]
MSKKLVSIVIPCINEEKNINRTLDSLLKLEQTIDYNFEILAINDGSKDSTWKVISEYATKYPQIIGIDQMMNFGQSAAYQAGFDMAHGEYIVTLSADLEIPIENITKVLSLLEDGYDFVNTHRVGRWGHEKASRQVQSGMANRIITKISGVSMMDRGSGLKGFKRQILTQLKLYGEMHRFIPDYLSAFGARMKEFDVEFKDRDYGKSAYVGATRTIKVMLDLTTLAFMLYFARKPFSMMPGRLFGFTGAVTTGVGGMTVFYLLILKLMGQSIGNRPLLTIAVLMVIVGIQSMMMGMIGELMLRTYFESSGRKNYMSREVVRRS